MSLKDMPLVRKSWRREVIVLREPGSDNHVGLKVIGGLMTLTWLGLLAALILTAF